MAKTSTDLLRTKTVRGKDLEGKTHTLVKTLPQQLQLFQTFLPDDDERYSNTIELYDAIPKYFTNPRAIPTVSPLIIPLAYCRINRFRRSYSEVRRL